MGKPTIIEMIEYVKDKLGENQAFEKLGIDRKTYYNYKGGGNPNKKKAKGIEAVYSEISMDVPLGNSDSRNVQPTTKTPSTDRELIDSLNKQIALLEKEVANCDALKENIVDALTSDLPADQKIQLALVAMGHRRDSFVRQYPSKKAVKGSHS